MSSIYGIFFERKFTFWQKLIEQKSNFGKQNYPARIGTHLATKHEATLHDTVVGKNPASVDMVNIPSCMLGGAGFLPSTVAGAALNLNCLKVSAPLNSSAFNKQVLRTQPAPDIPCQNRHCFYIRRIKQVSRCETTQTYKLDQISMDLKKRYWHW